MSLRSLKRPGAHRARVASALLALALAVSGCNYGFTGGGLPPGIRTVFIEPFENTTPYLQLTTDVQLALQEDLPRSLGVRLAPRNVADAVVRGRISGYEETAANVRPSADQGRVDVLQAEVRITFEAEIYDVRNDKPLWRQGGLTAAGTYNPTREQVQTARLLAIEEVTNKVVQGAQSQW